MLKYIRQIYENILFSYINPVLIKGLKSPLQIDDALPISEYLNAENCAKNSTEEWNLFSVFTFIKDIYKKHVFLLFTMLFSFALSLIAQSYLPMIVYKITDAVPRIANENMQTNEIIFIVISFVFLTLTEILGIQHYFYKMLKLKIRLENEISIKILNHCFKISLSLKKQIETGEIINYLSTDTKNASELHEILFTFIGAIISLIASSFVLHKLVGFSFVPGIILLIFCLFFSKIIMKKTLKIDDELMQTSDTRINLLSQFVNGIRILKYFYWEKGAQKEISQIREKEAKLRYTNNKLEALIWLYYSSLTPLTGLIIFAVHIIRGYTLNSALVFAIITSIGILSGPLGNIAYCIPNYARIKVSLERIIKFLNKKSNINNIKYTSIGNGVNINVKKLSLNFPNSDKEYLKNISFNVKNGQCLAIIGEVGAGKSTLLNTLIGELDFTGEIEFTGDELNKAYVAQQAFILNASVKENITFTSKISNETLKKALQVCDLEQDVKSFNNDINTEIGEHGVNLSGGQKQRISLARAYVKNPNVVFLDDPFSAVDAKVEEKLVKNLLFVEWKNITRIIVTHRLSYLNLFDNIIFMKNGEIFAQGSFNELCINCPEFLEYISIQKRLEICEDITTENIKKEQAEEKNNENKFIENEERKIGNINMNVYTDFFKSLCGDVPSKRKYIFSAFILILFTVIGLELFKDYWLGYNTDNYENQKNIYNISFFTFILVGYLLLSIICFLATYLQRYVLGWQAMKLGISFHDKALKALLQSSVSFFDTNPTGRIINRFSQDLYTVENTLVYSLITVLVNMVNFLIKIALIAFIMPYMLFLT